jgi:hypothetical protein
MLLVSPASAGFIQLGSFADLPAPTTTISFANLTQDSVPSPYVANAGGQTVTFSLHTGKWGRLDEGNNVFSDFVPGTSLLYTNNSSACGLHGCGGGRTGGGGSGPVDIFFSRGIGAFGLQAQTVALGDETFTISVYDALSLLGTFDVTGISAQRENGSAAFLGAAATDADVITRVHIASNVVQGGFSVPNYFAFGPVTFTPVPEPGSLALFLTGLLLLGLCRLAHFRGVAGAGGGASASRTD